MNFFAINYSSRAMRQNVYSSAVFTSGRPLCTQISPGQGRPHQPFLASDNKRQWATRWWRPHPSAFPHFDTIPQYEGRMNRYATAHTACAKLALWLTVDANVSAQCHWTCYYMTVIDHNWLEICYYTKLTFEYTVLQSHGLYTVH